MSRSIALFSLVAAAGTALAQPTLPAPIPTPVVPAGLDLRGLPFLAPGPFPATLTSNRINLITNPGGTMDGAGSNYVRFGGIPVGGPFKFTALGTNEGDGDFNISPNADLLNPLDPRAAFAFPTPIWDPIAGERMDEASGEPGYAWAATNAAGVLFATVAVNGRDNLFTDFGAPTGTLYGTAHSTPNDFRGGRGYDMLTGEFNNGNGKIYTSFQAVGLPTEYIYDIATAWFPFAECWTAGNIQTEPVRWTENAVAPDPETGLNVNWPTRSRDLPADAADLITTTGSFAQGRFDFVAAGLSDITPMNAMLFAQPGDDSNDDNILNLIEDGSGWEYLMRKDNGIDANGTDSAEFTPAGDGQLYFVALPYNTPNLKGGSINANGSVAKAAGSGFTVARTGVGRYTLAITGQTGETGSLMLQPTGRADGDASLPGRNFMSYQFDAAANLYRIESREVVLGTPGNIYGEEYPLVDSPFYLAFLSFSTPPQGPGCGLGCDAIDLTNDGTVDSGDLSAFINAFLTANPSADLTNDGQVDSGDLSLFITLFLECA